MRKFVSILLLSLSIITLIACTKNKQQYLDGEYYWISSERNELAFTIKGNRGSIKTEKLIVLQLIKKVTPSFYQEKVEVIQQ